MVKGRGRRFAGVAIEQIEEMCEGSRERRLLRALHARNRPADMLLQVCRGMSHGRTSGIGGVEVNPTPILGITFPADQTLALQSIEVSDQG